MGLFDFFRKKKPSADRDASSPTPSLCFVLCPSESPPDLSRLNSVVQRVFGPGYSADADEKNIVHISHGADSVGFLAHMPAPVPGDEAAENADGNFLWPEGKAAAQAHRSHVIVTNMGSGEVPPIQSAVTVARLALVALELFDGIGVYWGNASVSNSREVFESFCQDLSEEHVPLPVMMRFQFVPQSDRTLSLYTLGLRQFGLMEIEVERSRKDLGDIFEFVSNIAHYLVQSGPVIQDGNTVGGTAEEQIIVRHKPSMIDKSRKVYKIGM